MNDPGALFWWKLFEVLNCIALCGDSVVASPISPITCLCFWHSHAVKQPPMKNLWSVFECSASVLPISSITLLAGFFSRGSRDRPATSWEARSCTFVVFLEAYLYSRLLVSVGTGCPVPAPQAFSSAYLLFEAFSVAFCTCGLGVSLLVASESPSESFIRGR